MSDQDKSNDGTLVPAGRRALAPVAAANPLVARGIADLAQGRLLMVVSNAIRLDTKNALFYYNRGNALLDKGEYDKAIKDYDEAIRLDPNFASPFINHGNAWRAKKNYDKAIKDYDEAIRLDPQNAVFYKEDIEEEDKAIKDYDEGLRLGPQNAIFYNNRGVAWSEDEEGNRFSPGVHCFFLAEDHGDFQAIQDFDEAIRLDPQNAFFYNNRGVAWWNAGDYDKAIKDFDEAIRLDFRNAPSYYNRGFAWSFGEEDYDKAIKDFDEAIRLDPNYAPFYYIRGNAWFDKGDYDKAIKDYNEAIRFDPQNAPCYYNRGVAWSRKENYDKAIKDFDEASRLDANYAGALKYREIFSNNWRNEPAQRILKLQLRLKTYPSTLGLNQKLHGLPKADRLPISLGEKDGER